ncbi:TonB dependent receptor [Sphingobacterium sp. lm-10]|uniref:TonB-dependent receptor domain-containing protein n=1 Tax=Sphingobacterium sp. lm-10 TaxID=2944904 RepID=UPI0020209F9F|nr:TonB-dependent receptor [Sphingobacterium sp. lm-10]MCL7988022.1 TonB dependent receptor [Sphingobacterium sp. lm-10]
MLLKKILGASLLLLPILLQAQQKAQIQGIVVDAATKQPVSGASINILTQTTKAYLRGQQSQEDGKFRVENLDASTYALRVTNVGYDEYLQENITLAQGRQLTVDTIFLQTENRVIEDVVVNARTPDMQIGIDRKIFDVSQSLVSAGGTASELLANVPTLQVDQEGTVSLRGSSNVRILIDGKESAMAGSDIGALLQTLPAEVIDKVEIMTNPSSKYDAEGQSGIINIVLKKNARIGFNGSVNASGGSFGNAMAGATLNYRNDKFNHFGNYNFNRRVNRGDGFNENIIYRDTSGILDPSRRIFSTNDTRRAGNNHTLRLGTDYFLSEKTTLSLAGNLSLRENDRRQTLMYEYRNVPGNGPTGDRISQQFEDDLGLDLQFDFRQRLRKEGEELTANVSFGYDTEEGTNDFNETFAGSRADILRNNQTSEMGRNWNMQLDYVLPLGENHKFETGYRSIIRTSEDAQYSFVSRDGSGNLLPDYFLSNEFDLKNEVHALYVNYQRMLTSRLGAQFGLRGEQMNLTSTYYNLDPAAPVDQRATDGGYDFLRLFPSAYLTYEIGNQGDKIQLSYSRRVQRPRGWQVNPFISAADESNLRQGNPNLRPEDIHAAEMAYSKSYNRWNFVSTLFYRRTNDMINPLQVDPSTADLPIEFQNASYFLWENVGTSNDLGLELISKVDLASWWDITANVNIFNNRISPTIEGVGLNRVNTVNWDGNLMTNVKFMPTLSLQARGDYRSGRERPQGNMKAMYGMDLALKKDILRNRASILFNVRDVFNSRRFEMESFLPDRYIGMANRWNRRMLTLTFTYRFGIQDLFKRDEKRSDAPTGDMGGGEF